MTHENVFIQQLIDLLHLEPLQGEGGLFHQTYRARDELLLDHLPKRYPSRRRFSTAIYYLLTSEADSFSAMHRLLTDEVYHFYLGDPVEMLLLHPDGRNARIILGQDLLADQLVQFVVPYAVWQGSHLLPGGKFALLGTTMAPGFEYDEFVLGKREDLIRLYPRAEALITKLTRI
jgi:predicted cupin superfamily sugar epimerase